MGHLTSGRALSMLLFACVNILIFQNCGQGFQVSDQFRLDLESSGLANSFVPAETPGMRPLTAREYVNAAKVIIGDESQVALQSLPEETFAPFDNAFEDSSMSAAKVQGLEAAARDMTDRFLLKTAAQRLPFLGCTPSGVNDAVCFTKIVETVGLRAFRRPPTSAEVETYSKAIRDFASSGNNVDSGLRVFLNVILQHPAVVYRWEVGKKSADGKTYVLDDYELASRLSFALFGLPPDDQLLKDAAAGRLTSSTEYKTVVARMIGDPRFLDHVDFFHAAWLGYQGVTRSTPMSRAMRDETKALIERVVIDEKAPWVDLLTKDETFLTRDLATHYGMTPPATDGAWVKYPDEKRRGILSHGTFLSVGAKFGDTSPVQRGYHIRKQLFCESIAPPPPGIDVDTPPSDVAVTSPCKIDQHRASTMKPGTSCIGCHSRMDPVGFGLEQYSAAGQFRTVEPEHPTCAISGLGELAPYGSFSGPGALGRLAKESGRVEKCMVERWIQLSYGLRNPANLNDLVAKNNAKFRQSGRLSEFLESFVLSDDFKVREALGVEN